MLVEFRVANFRSFREEQTFSLIASKDEKLAGNLIPSSRFNLLKSAALYGANASGKSNFIKAISFFKGFVLASATRMNQGDPIENIAPFRLDATSRTQPSFFEITLLVDKTLYRYGFSATVERVYDEWLVVLPAEGKKSQSWFDRRFNSETQNTTFTCRGPVEEHEKLLRERTRDNGLVLSRGAELNIKPLSDLFLCIKNQLGVIDSSADIDILVRLAMHEINEEPKIADTVQKIMRDADLSIERIEVCEQSDLSKITAEAPKEFRSAIEAMFNSLPGNVKPIKRTLKTFHTVSNSGELSEFDLVNDESQGTMRFFSIVVPLVKLIDSGATVFVDEIDCSMHPLLTRKLIELFQSPEVNPSGTQLVFTTHDSSLMDVNLFRRDQIWLAEKNSDFATTLCSLYDFQERPRNTEAIERNYLAGRYGGVPHFGATFEDLILK